MRTGWTPTSARAPAARRTRSSWDSARTALGRGPCSHRTSTRSRSIGSIVTDSWSVPMVVPWGSVPSRAAGVFNMIRPSDRGRQRRDAEVLVDGAHDVVDLVEQVVEDGLIGDQRR
jgi:hypothetical protein